MRREEEVRLTHSGIFAKDGRRCVSVRFERGKGCRGSHITGMPRDEE